ncbi:uncharacterized protein Z519_12608 [Cladophialophora bantiana CBS 173.52]|uniref:Uncharacterized protein n=1 Tax=Cladophialophora bantiana (strain ATCC 10958 / CBS 173.52 / CDC B-1940 / NIH 8579) TaxID=1442370 RepID=A0A0D2FJE5_CLAB1|nr:uncharacterized protein Z519_12608 [Cladophialophora bantiana CBS 173.52]KIW86822.1 hypothetical protein Z519_12608 [Cladophialophora bantiana CBS 173.52]
MATEGATRASGVPSLVLHTGAILEKIVKREFVDLWCLAQKLESAGFKRYLRDKGKECFWRMRLSILF